MPTVILEGTYRDPENKKAFRVVQNNDKLIVEYEIDRDAMDGIVWKKDNSLSPYSPGGAILKELIKKAGLIK